MAKFLTNKYLFSTIFISSFFFFTFSFANADTASDLQSTFDFVERFDDIADWRGTGYGNVFYQGPNSDWEFFSEWDSNPDTTANWIANHGVQNVWGGTGKSLSMDLSQGGSKGPSRFGRYFGGGTPDSGYKEVYVFYMVKISNNYFPRQSDGITYDWFSYWKFNTISTGFVDIESYDPNNAEGLTNQGKTYGRDYSIANIYVWNYGSPCIVDATNPNAMRITQGWFYDFNGPNYDSRGKYTDGCLDNRGEWFGVEFYYDLGTPGQPDGRLKAWLYDDKGNGQLTLDLTQEMVPAGRNVKFNKFFFGGNYSWNDSSYSGLNKQYYIDDFIIDDQRIGPEYFFIIQGSTPSAPPPTPDTATPPTPDTATPTQANLQTTVISSSQVNTLLPEADTALTAGTGEDNRNNGGSAKLTARNSVNAYHRDSLLRFDLNGINPSAITSANLRLYRTNNFTGNTLVVKEYQDNWDEMTVTWDNAPASGSIISSLPLGAVDTWQEINVTNYVKNQTDNKISFSLTTQDQTYNWADYSSRESANPPELVINTNQSQTLQGDLSGDGIINTLDWSIMNSKWNTADTQADLNNDGIVNSIDFSILNGGWGK